MFRSIHKIKHGLMKSCVLLCTAALLLPCLTGAVYAEPSQPPQGDLPVWNGGSAASYEGIGTESDPFCITTGEELALLAQHVRAGNDFSGKYFLLTADIQLNDTSDYDHWQEEAPARRWIPIGGYATVHVASREDYERLSTEADGLYLRTEEGYQLAEQYQSGVIYYRLTAFSGIFDGGGHTVSGLYTADGSDYLGLFGACANAVLKNIRLSDLYVAGSDHAGALSGALLAGGDVTVTNCSVEGTVLGAANVGGLFGSAQIDAPHKLTVNACTFVGKVNGTEAVGGILGASTRSLGILQLTNCTNLGQITATSRVGGIAGALGGANDQIMSCKNNGAIRGTRQTGGIAGEISPTDGIVTVSDSQNGGTVLADDQLGGIVGEARLEGTGSALELLSCRNVGQLFGQLSVGGIAGHCLVDGSENSITLIDNKNSASVSGKEQIGGTTGSALVNAGEMTVRACENYGSITATERYAGGIVGKGDSFALLQLTECSIRSAVTAGDSFSGGVAGRLSASDGSVVIDRCSAGGTVKANGSANGTAGGIAGELITLTEASTATVQNCLSAVTLSARGYAGGIVGELRAENGESRITTSLFCGGIVTGCKITGGIAAIASAESENSAAQVTDCYFSQSTSSRAMLPGGGKGKESCLTTEALTDSDLRDTAKLGALDFSIWQAPASDTQFPTLQSVPFVWEEYQYTVTHDGAIVSIYLGRSDIAVIPDKLGGVAVTTISDEVFCRSNVIRVEMPDTVTTIGEAAFAGCQRLERVTLSASLNSVHTRAFADCPALTELRCSGTLSTLTVGGENDAFHAARPYVHPVDLQIVHSFEDGRSAGKTASISCYVGDYYEIAPLEIVGHEADTSQLTGICEGASRISVIYRIGTYHLSIRYLYPDGKEAHPSFEGDFVFGESYSVATPKIDGYSADRTLIEGNMPGEHTQLTVYFNEIFAESDENKSATLEIALLILSGLTMLCCLVYFIYRYRSATDPQRTQTQSRF